MPLKGERERVTRMKKVRKAFAVLLALAVLMAMSVTAFAAATDDVSVTVTGIKEGNTLKLIFKSTKV